MRLPYLTPLAACVMLSACGGSDGGTSGTETTPSLGLIRNATVNFYRADDPACPLACEQVGTGDTGTSGVISARISGYSGPMVVEVVGDADAEYFDEQSDKFEPFTAADRLRALTPGSSGRFGVTLLTELAYQRAVAEGRFPLSATSVRAINESVRTALAPELSDILATPGLISDSTAAGSLRNNKGNLYALKLAAFASLGDGAAPSPALAVLNALVDDIQDGTIDGQNNGAALVPAAPYNPATLASDLQNAMNNFAADYADATLTGVVNALNSTLTLALFENPDDGGGDDGGGEPGDGSSITALFNGERVTADVSDYTGPPLSVGAGYASAGSPADAFYFNLSGITNSLNVDRACNDSESPGLSVRFNDAQYSSAPTNGGSCTVTTVELTDSLIRVTFSGTLVRTDDNETQPETLEITEGEFQYVVETFGDEPAPQVVASFEGLGTDTLTSQGDGTGDRGWLEIWGPSAMSVVDVSANPLAVTPSGGDELAGGDRALRFPGVADSRFGSQAVRQFEKRFDGDVYISALWRVETATPGENRARISFGNPAVFMGIDSSYDAAVEGPRINQFTVSLGDGENQRAYAGGTVQGNTTHHVVGRLYKADGSATYNRFDLWIDPARNASGTPSATATGLGGTGSLSFIDTIGFAGQSIQNPTTLDRIRFSSTWDGVFEDAIIEEPPATGTCGGTEEAPFLANGDPDLIGTCAGTYNIAFVHRDATHSRGTVIIGADNSVDFDTGISLSAAGATVTNRITQANRIDIDYANGDKITLYRTQQGVLRNVHYEPSDDDAVKVSMLPQLPQGDGDASALTASNLVASGTVKGEVKIQETVFGTTNPITGNFGVFEVRGQGHQTTVPATVWTLTNIPAETGTHYCQPFDFALQVTYLRVSDSGAAQSGGGGNAVGRCTVTVTDIQTNPSNPAQIIGAEGKFAVELLSTGPDGTGKLVDTVTDGYFRFFPE